MRPHTLAEACRRAQAGEPFEQAIGDFLQAYYLAQDIAARVPMLADEPPPFADRRYDALVGGIAEYLYKRWAPFRAAALDQEPHALPRSPVVADRRGRSGAHGISHVVEPARVRLA